MKHRWRIVEFIELATGEKQDLANALAGEELTGWEVFAVLPSSTLSNTILIVLRMPRG